MAGSAGEIMISSAKSNETATLYKFFYIFTPSFERYYYDIMHKKLHKLHLKSHEFTYNFHYLPISTSPDAKSLILILMMLIIITS